ITPAGASAPEAIWPAINEIDLPLKLLSTIKSRYIADNPPSTLTFYDESEDEVFEVSEFAPRVPGELRIGIQGNPALGTIRALMVGVKNTTNNPVCGEVWFNELRLAELDNKGGWAATAAVDANMADFANVSATGRISTIGFGSIEQTPNERSREALKQYDVVTNINLGQLLPQKWGVQLPLNYSHSEELITPEFDAFYQDITLEDRLDAASSSEERKAIRQQSESYTKRQSINLVGLRKNRSPEAKPNFFDIENFTFNYSYNETNHRDFEIEKFKEQNIRTGFLYNYNFKPLTIEPFKKSDSLFTGRYWKWLKELNFNILPASISVNSNITRSFNQQKFREVFTEDGPEQLGLPTLQQRNFLFDWQYAINYNLSKSLRLNFTASNYNIVRNYFEEDDMGNSVIREDLGIWNGFWNTGEANRHTTQLQLNYDIPLNKIPIFSFINAAYVYTGNFDWQRGSIVLEELSGGRINTIQNANTHTLNASLSMNKLYSYLGLDNKRRSNTTSNNIRQNNGQQNNGQAQKKESKVLNTLSDIITMVKRININYSENNGKVLPGYTESVGFIGTLRPSWGFVFGSQSNVRYEMARKGWLTRFPEFNQQYMQQHNTNLNITASIEPLNDLTIDVVTDRLYSENYTENFRVNDLGGGNYEYENLLGNQFGNFSISTWLITTAFQKTDNNFSETFETFKANRLIIANRLALRRGIDITNPANLDSEGYPLGYGKNNQAVLLPAFIAAYTGKSVDAITLGAFRAVPIPNWTVKYTGFMRLKWFKKTFNRFSLSHAYRASYSLNSFRTNLEYDTEAPDEVDLSGNYRNPTLYTNATLVEQFSPLARIDFETKNSFNILAELRRDRALSLSFDNNLLTEITGKEYILGFGYRIKDVRFNTNFGGKKTILRGDMNLRADVSLRDNITVIRNMEIDNSQVTSGQTIWTVRLTADYALSKNLT
ncbi:MAG: cell surface protein SprA, partial [Bacteroidota bacterium]